jgi:molybdenum cofactor cytidylyltransferase
MLRKGGEAMRVAAVVLAAGKSERMGRNKLLLKLGGKALIEHILDALEASKVNEIVVVLGNKPMEVADVIKPRLNRTRIIVNENYEEGMTSSFKTGLKQIEHADAALLILGDQLILDQELVNAMIEEMEKNRGRALIVSPIYEGKKGHPLLFSEELFKEILALKDGEVIRDIVHRHIDQFLNINGPNWTKMDIDTPKDFEDAVQLFNEYNLRNKRKQAKRAL